MKLNRMISADEIGDDGLIQSAQSPDTQNSTAMVQADTSERKERSYFYDDDVLIDNKTQPAQSQDIQTETSDDKKDQKEDQKKQSLGQNEAKKPIIPAVPISNEDASEGCSKCRAPPMSISQKSESSKKSTEIFADELEEDEQKEPKKESKAQKSDDKKDDKPKEEAKVSIKKHHKKSHSKKHKKHHKK